MTLRLEAGHLNLESGDDGCGLDEAAAAKAVNGHIKSIYEKLHVHSRGQAVAVWMRR